LGRFHPVAFRQKVVNPYEVGEGSYREIGERFGVGEASVNRWVALERKTGSLALKQQGRRTGPTKATPKVVALILRLVDDESTITSSEIVEVISRELDVQMCRQTVCKVLSESGVSSKRGSYVRGHTELKGS
jgi:transposase